MNSQLKLFRPERRMKNTTFKRNTLIGVMAFVLSLVMVFTMAVNDPSHAASPTPGKVTLMKISAPAYNKVTISWKKVSNATHYKVYYRKAGTSKWIGLKTLSNKYSSYTHTSSSSKKIVVGQKYNYTVKAYNSKSKKYGKYNTKGLTVNTIPATVKLGTAKLNSDDTVTITWNKAAGANKYIVYCRNESNTKWIRFATVSSSTLTYTDKYPYKGQTNIYTVKSYYSSTGAAGKYNSKGISVFVPQDEDYKPADPDMNPNDIKDIQKRVLDATNEVRAKYGCAPIKLHEGLCKAAAIRAKELSIKFSHTRPDGTDSSTVGYDVWISNVGGENIARGYYTPESAVRGWENSSLHCVQMISNSSNYLGVGFYKAPNGTYYWVQEFAGANPDTIYTVTFDATGGKFNTLGDIDKYVVETVGVVYMRDVPVPVKPGYTFDGWVDKYGIKLNYAGGDYTMYATWK